jgi:hypothetical protein
MLAAAAMLLAGCAKNIDNADAVKQGVIDYLQQRKAETGLDMNLMQVDVVAVSFEKDQARATVMFRPKSGADAAGMKMAYTLDRKGSKWVVAGRSDSGGNPHGGAMSAPDGSQLPPGHPAMPQGSGAGALPPGHPPVSPKQ